MRKGTRISKATGSSSPTTTRGDLIYRGASADQRLAKGNVNDVLTMGANDPAWVAPAAAGFTTPYIFNAYKASDQNSATDDFATIVADTENYDVGGCWDVSASKFTAPVDGIYTFSCTLNISGLTLTDEAEIWLKKNNTTYVARTRSPETAPKAAIHLCRTIRLVATDYIQFQILTVGACTITAGTRESWVEGYFLAN